MTADGYHARSSVPTFLVPDIAASLEWYAEQLGFRTAGVVPPTPPHVYASMQLGTAEIMLLSAAGYTRPDTSGVREGGAWDAYIRGDGVASLYERVRGRPFVRMPLTQQPYGDWEFEVQDPDGYVLTFGGTR